MSIHIIFGKPGSGKSRYGTQKIIDELLESDRHIVTNFPLVMERLNEYLQEAYPARNVACCDRITLLSDDELSRFYQVRGPREGGVAYFLDEAQIPFNARDWVKQGANGERPLFAYLTQHRKLGDVVYAFTQHPGNLDKQFRSLAQDFRRLRNDRLLKLGMLRGFDQFVVKHYDVEPASTRAEPYLIEKFKLDPEGVASCYDTARGIGVRGSKADIGARAKGLTLGWGVAGLVGLASLVFIVPFGFSKLTAAAMSKRFGPAETVSVPPAVAAGPVGGSTAGDTREAALAPGLELVGFTHDQKGGAMVFFADGTVLTHRDASLERIEGDRVKVDGVWYRLRARKPIPALEAPQAPAGLN